MKVITGRVIEMDDSSDLSGSKLSFIDQNYTGANWFCELMDSGVNLQATIKLSDGDTALVPLPTQNFIALDDVITAVKDDDGCGLFYKNHSKDRVWRASRSPKNVRSKFSLINFLVKAGFLFAVPTFALASFATWDVFNLNAAFALSIATIVFCIGWVLIVQAPSAKRHIGAAEEMADRSEADSKAFIAEQRKKRAEGK